MSETSARLSLPFIQAAQAQKHVTHNEALILLDALVQLAVRQFAAETPPTVAEDGDIWALGVSPTGAWAGQGGKLAFWANGGWLFIDPQAGWRAAHGTDLRVFDGAGWQQPDLPALQNLPGIGVGTAHDTINRLAVAAEATLLTHAGEGHQLKINKNASPDTASLLFQSGWSGRAEFGLAGSDDFSVKVSPDGSVWHDVLVADRTTGALTLGQPLPLASGGTGAATAAGARAHLGLGTAATADVTTSSTDATAGRVMRTRDHGLGAPTLGESAADFNGPFPVSFQARFSPSNAPPGGQGWCLINLPRNESRHVQLALRASVATTDNPIDMIAIRQSLDAAAGTWFPWLQIYHGRNVVGTVSQSDGVPTGAVIQRGSNSNGAFVRFADGTQICWRTDINLGSPAAFGAGTLADPYRTEVLTWTYPAAFVAPPAGQVTVRSNSSDGRGRGLIGTFRTYAGSGNGGTMSSIAAYRVGSNANAEDVFAQLAAVGRWF